MLQTIASLEIFLAPSPDVPPEVIFGGQKFLALQFQYIVTLANCNKASIKKSSADSLARNEI